MGQINVVSALPDPGNGVFFVVRVFSRKKFLIFFCNTILMLGTKYHAQSVLLFCRFLFSGSMFFVWYPLRIRSSLFFFFFIFFFLM